MKRLEAGDKGDKGRQMRCMGVRGAVEVWKATRELESMVGDEMDVDAEGDTDDECDDTDVLCEDEDPFAADVEIQSARDCPVVDATISRKATQKIPGKGKALRREGSLMLSNSWVVVPGEDWEMVDCAAS